ncbi:hypothetical protein [Paraburkholderia youngii]|uniref:hypothetical protein n=1 Tax=Paraburkholderia youngii TaxID=2782701 RepID=UPI001590A12B|nr:hypothetical protein [Paraburkholderia youngii]NUX55954.1 hypothetical protein [Paraburkholderia youngii]
MSDDALTLLALNALPKPHGGLITCLELGVAAHLIEPGVAYKPPPAGIEQQRIADHAHGWNDAARGRQPRSMSIAYSLGYSDGSR